jgi:hypothetical protein
VGVCCLILGEWLVFFDVLLCSRSWHFGGRGESLLSVSVECYCTTVWSEEGQGGPRPLLPPLGCMNVSLSLI